MALEPFWQLQRQLTLISLIGVVVSIIASIAIARSIGRPVRELAGVARRIAAGDYAHGAARRRATTKSASSRSRSARCRTASSPASRRSPTSPIATR